ncbi:MFS transporter [Thermomonospora umbrina]|uniref:EmrB/QacA subfamily drug resistance transporter n=1 Tax=Thermomonospora umbrina TaxID=111806 RepID=A0A3D9SUK4_9ACTN|nr:MFS transporter [Thermomonospora umbrina]REE99468.1 EmrB/QacA subfamily drug resistance transporter [Thermomonospora umbrina]
MEAHESTGQTGHPRRWAILGVLVFSLLVVVLDNTILNVALRTIADPDQGLGATQSELEWSINSYTLVFAGLLFTFGVLGDRLGRKRTLVLGMMIFGLGSLASAYAQSPGQLIGARALMGLGGAAIMPQTLSIITHVFDPRERARAIGIWSGSVGLAVAIGPVTGGLLLDHFWWGSVFLINVPIVVGAVIAMIVLVPESRNPRPGRLDPFGVLLSIVGLVVLSYGIIEGGERGSWLEPAVLGPIVAGAAVIAAFVWHEARTEHPAFDVRLFRDPRLSVAVGSIAFCFFATAGVFFFGSFYLQSVRNLSPLEAGAMMLPFAVAQLAVSPRSAALVGRFGARAVCATGMLLVTLSLAGYQLCDADSPLWIFGAIAFVMGAGMAGVMPPATESIMSAVPREKAGAGSAINNTARQVAVAMGVAVLGSVVASIYRGEMKDRLTVLPESLPEDVRHAAGESIEGTLAVVARLGGAGDGLVAPAHEAFVHGMHIAALTAAVVSFLGALLVARWMPGRAVPKTAADPEAVRSAASAPKVGERL